MLSRFPLIWKCYGQTDRFAISIISHVRVLTRDKNQAVMIF